jgi:hypothetical protein
MTYFNKMPIMHNLKIIKLPIMHNSLPKKWQIIF